MAILDQIEEWPVGQPGWNSMVKQILDRSNASPEFALDALAQKLVAGSGIAFNYNSATKILTISGTGAEGLDTEAMMDYIASNITVGGLTGEYDDPAGTIDFPSGGSSSASGGGASNPIDHGLLDWITHPDLAQTSVAPVAGTIYLCRFRASADETVNSICNRINTAGTTPTNCYVGLYDMSGNRMGVSADLATPWASTGEKVNALTAGVPLNRGVDYVYAMLVGGGTPPAFTRASASSMCNYGISLPNFRVATFSTALTALPTTINFSTVVTNTGLIQFWAGMKA